MLVKAERLGSRNCDGERSKTRFGRSGRIREGVDGGKEIDVGVESGVRGRRGREGEKGQVCQEG
jgi:hypothetical protein